MRYKIFYYLHDKEVAKRTEHFKSVEQASIAAKKDLNTNTNWEARIYDSERSYAVKNLFGKDHPISSEDLSKYGL